jgi:hypothetical protein
VGGRGVEIMPNETKDAVLWALSQGEHGLVDKVREYFNNNEIEYETFTFDDLIPFLPNGGV